MRESDERCDGCGTTDAGALGEHEFCEACKPAGWTAEEFDASPEMGTRLHRRILDLEDAVERWKQSAWDDAQEIMRLRDALKKIAEVDGPPYPDWQFAGRAEDREAAMQATARRALSDV